MPDTELMVDELAIGSVVVGRMELRNGDATYQALVFDTPKRERVAVYLDKKANRFRVIKV